MISTAAPAGWTLPATRPRALTAQAILLISAAWLLPTAAHLGGLPVRQLLPMHWPALMAGLCYGWRSGLLVGAGAPLVSYVIAGMPRPAVIPAMTVELAAYGCIAGLMIEVLRRGRAEATLASLIGGRLLFVAVMVLTGAVVGPLGDYLRAAMVPGLAAAVVQALVLPPLATWWVRREQRRG